MLLHHHTQVQRAQGVNVVEQGRGLGQQKIASLFQPQSQARGFGVENLQGLRHLGLGFHAVYEIGINHDQSLLLFALSLSKGFDRLSPNGVVC
jgi:hypothetical protein